MTEIGDGGEAVSAAPGDVCQVPDHADPLRGALLDSRERWRDLVRISSDMAFETDAAGQFVFLSPDSVAGWRAQELMGRGSEVLIAEAEGIKGFDPFRTTAPIRNRRAWIRRQDGSLCWMSFSASPLLDAAGDMAGVRGIARDVTEFDRAEAAMARELRRSELTDHILWSMRSEVMAPRMMHKALQALVATLGADGVMVVESDPARRGSGAEDEAVLPDLLHAVGGDVPAIRAFAIHQLRAGLAGPARLRMPDGQICMVAATPTRFEGSPGLVLWRAVGRRDWEADDLSLLAATIGTVRVLLEHGAIQHEMTRQARTDALTGLFNRRAFTEEMGRRLDRLERDRLPGTLVFIDLDNFKSLNDQCGHAAGDEGLKVVAGLLRDIARPGDLLARLGGDEFAAWFDGMDHLTASERADALGRQGALALSALSPRPLGLSLSIGVATRWPGSGLDTETLLRQADDAMYQAKRDGKGTWRVWRQDDGNAV